MAKIINVRVENQDNCIGHRKNGRREGGKKESEKYYAKSKEN